MRKETFYTSSNYSGSSHPRHGLSVPESRIVAKSWAIQHKQVTLKEFLYLLNSLCRSESVDERKMVGQLLQYLPNLRSQISPEFLKGWIDTLEGWEEIDSLCQSVFSYKDLLLNWKSWEKCLRDFGDLSLSHKRASLVLLTGPVYQSGDERISNLAFENIERLKGEKDILITKAISWLLRSLIRLHKEEVEKYLQKNEDTLPKIAVRETKRKLSTGKK